MMKKEDVIPSERSDQDVVIPSERSEPRDLYSRTGGRVEIPPLASLGRDDNGQASLARDDNGQASLGRDDNGQASLARDDKRASNPFSGFLPRPPHVADWEELLLRYELTPRAMGNALESSERDSGLLIAGHLGRIVAAERAAIDWFTALRAGDGINAEWQPAPETGDADALLEEFASLRARNFAGLQRRGIRVWDWSTTHPDLGEVSAFQFLSASIARDAREMQAIRDATRTDTVC